MAAAKDAGEDAIRLIAVGKAASRMAAGVVDAIGAPRIAGGLVVTKDGHARDPLPAQVRVLEASHPLPDPRSLLAGQALLAEVTAPGEPIWLLVSGGASALAVLPTPGVTLAEKIARTRALMAAGASIQELNAERARLSAIKGGRLVAAARAPVRAFVLSDVVGDDLATIGGGLALGAEARVLAGPDDLAGEAARALGAVDVLRTRFVDSVEALARLLVEQALADRVCVIGGEPTLVLGPSPGRGGRAQHAALLCARDLRGSGFSGAILCAASDGTDGPTDDAGAIVDAGTVDRSGLDPDDAAARHDAGTLLQAAGDLLVTGPTGNNLCDLYVVSPAR
jgi:hydroxypyruvate reductase